MGDTETRRPGRAPIEARLRTLYTATSYFTPRGYLVVAPDYRGYAGSDAGPNLFYTGYYADVLALIPLAQALPMARPGKDWYVEP